MDLTQFNKKRWYLLEKETISIAVSDDGPGLKPEDAGKVFDSFFTRKKTMGMGVGLSICYGIVEDHQRSIEFNPASEEGAELIEPISKNGFWFKIKAAANIKPEEYSRISRI